MNLQKSKFCLTFSEYFIYYLLNYLNCLRNMIFFFICIDS